MSGVLAAATLFLMHAYLLLQSDSGTWLEGPGSSRTVVFQKRLAVLQAEQL